MQGVVPAAGSGTRMRPRTATRPKGLVEVAGIPLLARVFQTLVDLGVDELVVVVGSEGDLIREQFGPHVDGVPLRYVTQSEPRGLAHALVRAAPAIDGPFLWMHGDNVCEANLAAVRDRHRSTDAVATCLVERVPPERARQGGVFELADGDIVGAVEKPDDPPSRLVPRGFYAFDEPVIRACELVRPLDSGERELTTAIDVLLAAGWAIQPVPIEGWCVNVNEPSDIRRAESRLAGGD